MPSLQEEVCALVRHEGIVVRREHPRLARAVDALRATGALVPVLPGVYVPPAARTDFATLVLAASRWDPDVVLCDEAAARLTFWPDLVPTAVGCATKWQRPARPGYRFSRRVVPAELVVERHGVRVTDPAMTALDLCASHDGDGIDRVLRTRSSTLARMRLALELTPARAGNRDRRRLLLDSRDEPWSAAERTCHRVLRTARLPPWRTNLPVVVGGARYYLDVAFPALRLAIEVDGRIHQTDRALFESDRERQNALVLAGWTVLRFTWRMIEDHPDEVLAAVLEAVSVLSSASRPRRR